MSFFLVILSSLLFIFAYPPFDLYWISFFVLCPFFWVLLRGGAMRGLFLGLLFGIVFFAGVLFWMNGLKLPGVMPWQKPILWISLTTALSLFTGFFGFIVGFLSNKLRTLSWVFFPLVWCSVEFARTHFPFGGFPWVLLAHSQYLNPPFIQISEYTGAYGVSFLLALLNVSFAWLFLKSFSLRRRIFPLCFAFFLVFGCWAWGASLLRKSPVEGDLKISAIQGNFPIEMSWNWRDRKSEFYKRLKALTNDVLRVSPTLIIWTESIILEPVAYLPPLVEELSSLFKEGVFLLLGAPHPSDRRYYNSAFLISRYGVIGRYDKIHLVPFGEYLPLERLFPVIRRFIPQCGSFLSGSRFTIFSVNGARFGVLICFEGIFPPLSRRFIQKGAGFLVNITNDAWSMSEASHLQHFQSIIFRAIENRCYIVRAGNTGVTAIVDPFGRVVKRLPVATPGFIIDEINPIVKKRTFYTRWGDLFSWMCIIIACFGLIRSF
jgi:apolipoprotein N-acyltransferase